MPKRTGRSRRNLKSAIDFYRKHSGKIQNEHSLISHALRSIEYSSCTVHPLRPHLWSQPASLCTPSLDELEDQHKKWFPEYKLDTAPVKESLRDLKQIQDRISHLWLRTGATLPKGDADPCIALEAAQRTLKHMPFRKDITTYLHTMALLVYSSRKSLEYSARLLSLWVHVAKTHRGAMFREMDTRRQVLRSAFAFSYEERTWGILMLCPWTVACALHLLADDATEPRTKRRSASVPTTPEAMECTESGGTARPPKSDALFAAVGSALVQRMLEDCFRLAVTRSENNRLLHVVRPFIAAEGQEHKRSIHIDFVSDMSGHGIGEADVIQMIREYWKEQAFSDTCYWLREESELLFDLADTPALSDTLLHMNLGRPKAHCECILAQHWMARRHLTNQVFPHIGVSAHACRTCRHFLWAVLLHTDKHPTAYGPDFTMYDASRRMIPGTRGAYHLCMVPQQSPIPVKERVADQLLDHVMVELSMSDRLITALKEELTTARGRRH